MAMAQFYGILMVAWEWLREACGENDYARHCARAKILGVEPLTLQAFYLTQLHSKYSRPSRCC